MTEDEKRRLLGDTLAELELTKKDLQLHLAEAYSLGDKISQVAGALHQNPWGITDLPPTTAVGRPEFPDFRPGLEAMDASKILALAKLIAGLRKRVTELEQQKARMLA